MKRRVVLIAIGARHFFKDRKVFAGKLYHLPGYLMEPILVICVGKHDLGDNCGRSRRTRHRDSDFPSFLGFHGSRLPDECAQNTNLDPEHYVMNGQVASILDPQDQRRERRRTHIDSFLPGGNSRRLCSVLARSPGLRREHLLAEEPERCSKRQHAS